jgi:hypothetical protein
MVIDGPVCGVKAERPPGVTVISGSVYVCISRLIAGIGLCCVLKWIRGKIRESISRPDRYSLLKPKSCSFRRNNRYIKTRKTMAAFASR